MARLVISHKTLLALADHRILFLRTHHDPLDRIADLVVAHLGEFTTRRKNGGFIQKVGEVCARVTRCPAGHLVEIDILGQGLATGMNSQDLKTTGVIRTVNGHLTVETAGTQQGCIENIRPVGGRNDDDAGIALETVHFGEQLVEGLLPLIISTTEASTPLASNGIDLIDEDDAGGVLLGLLEQVTNPAGSDAHEHLDEFRT